ncbi:hypothetical protein ACQEVB_01505 [Pseudonocardia sp. CA-107938]|uniref:hypothetical protein n=1 Tax=Pseudonocardia sp. CA-107938 TaxID=3240021 RepID=UPI003D8D57F5
MELDRITVTMDAELGAAVRAAAEAAKSSVSGWVAGAVADKLRNQLLMEALDEWQAEDGAFTESEHAAARALLESDDAAGTAA